MTRFSVVSITLKQNRGNNYALFYVKAVGRGSR